MFTFEASSSDELSFKKGEVLNVLDTSEKWWWEASKPDGTTGVVPSHYVKVIAEDEGSNREVLFSARALFTFEASSSDELSFKKGEVLNVLDTSEKWWWEASKPDGTTGVVPSNFVKVIPEDEGSNREVLFSVRVLFTFEASSFEQLSFEEGDVLTVLDTSQGVWWLASKPNGTTGDIPSNLVAIIDEDEAVQPITAEGDRGEIPGGQAPPSQGKQSFTDWAWFWGKMTRRESEDVLENQGSFGGFLMRESESRVRHCQVSAYTFTFNTANTSLISLNVAL